MNRNLLVLIGIVVVLVVVGVGIYAINVKDTITTSTSKPQQPTPKTNTIPLTGSVTITDCIADHQLLGIKVGETLTVKNADNIAHTLVVEKKVTLPANGTVEIVIVTKETIIQYTCDDKPAGTLAIAD